MSILGHIGKVWREIGNARQKRKLGGPAAGGMGNHRRATWLADGAQLDTLLERTGYTECAGELHRAARPCLHLFEAGAAEQAVIGATRFGGLPDLPLETEWPRAPDDAPLLFYAQIALRDVAETPVAGLLPETGLLSFFAGDLQADPIPVMVLLSPQGSELCRCQPPGDDGPDVEPLKPVSVRFEPGLTLPLFDRGWMEAFEAGNPDGNHDALTEAFWPPFPVLGQFLGHSSWSDDDLRARILFQEIGRPGQERLRIFESWEHWERGKAMESKLRGGMIYRPWSARDDDNVRWILDHREVIGEGVNRWQSLLSIESNAAMNLWINDANAIYFFIDSDDLRAGIFSRVRALTTQN